MEGDEDKDLEKFLEEQKAAEQAKMAEKKEAAGADEMQFDDEGKSIYKFRIIYNRALRSTSF